MHKTARPPPLSAPPRQIRLMFTGPLTVAEAMALGAKRQQLRGKQWRAPFWGMREARSVPETLGARCQALATVAPGDTVFSGMTAARLRGWWLPRGAEALPLHVTVSPGRVIERPGVRSSRRLLGSEEVVQHEGLWLTSGVRTLTDLAADWPLLDLVVMADAALRFGDCTAEELTRAAQGRGGRGIRTLRRAIALADARSESPRETLLRLVIVVPGLPAPTPQVVLRDSIGGWLARVDLLGADGRSVFEYDGASHDDPRRHASDVTRWRLLRREGYEVFPYTARDIDYGAAQIIADYERALGLRGDPRAVGAWLREWQLSSFGRQRRS